MTEEKGNHWQKKKRKEKGALAWIWIEGGFGICQGFLIYLLLRVLQVMRPVVEHGSLEGREELTTSRLKFQALGGRGNGMIPTTKEGRVLLACLPLLLLESLLL